MAYIHESRIKHVHVHESCVHVACIHVHVNCYTLNIKLFSDISKTVCIHVQDKGVVFL